MYNEPRRCCRCNTPLVSDDARFCGVCGAQQNNSYAEAQTQSTGRVRFSGNNAGHMNSSYPQNGAAYIPPVQPAQPTYAGDPYGSVVYPPPMATPSIPSGLSKKEFAKKYANTKNRNGIKTAVIIGYICAILSVIVNVGIYAGLGVEMTAGTFAYLGVLVGVMLGCTIGLQVTYNKGFAIGMLVISALDCILTLIMYQQFGGWLPIVAAISAIKALSDIDKEYDQYLYQM